MKRYQYLTIGLLAALTVFHLLYIHANATELAPDEAYYWEWSRRLDWGYYSKGPLVAYLIAASTRLGESSEFFVRLPAVVLALGTGILVYLLATELFATARAGFLAVLIASIVPLYSAGSILMTIDAPLVFFWTLALYAGWRAERAVTSGAPARRVRSWWILVGLSIGLGWVSKYTMLLMVPCLAAVLLTSPSRREQLASWGPHSALLLAGLVSCPTLMWNAEHGWVSVRHTLARIGLVGEGVQLSGRTLLDFLGSQIGVVSPLIFFALVAATIRAGRLAMRGRGDRHRFVFLFSAPLLAFFVLWSTHTKVEANWAAPAYLCAIVALAGWWEELLTRAERRGAVRARVGVMVLILLPGLLVTSVAYFPGMLPALGIEVPPRLDPTSRLQGWRELGAAIDAVRRRNGSKETPLLSDRYQTASELAFYVPGQPAVYKVPGARMDQYDVWGGLDRLTGGDAIFVTDVNTDGARILREVCDSARKIDVVEVRRRGVRLRAFSVFHCQRFDTRRAPAVDVSD
jgi:4-amino-4-deoxy-L-arabinose transferase-like glycosyltransferase